MTTTDDFYDEGLSLTTARMRSLLDMDMAEDPRS